MERLRLILLGLAGLVIAGLVLQQHYPALRPVPALAMGAGAAASVDSVVPVSYLADPETSAYFTALKDALPQEYDGIIRQISSVHDAVAPVGAPDALAFAMRRLREDYGVLAGRAPLDNLDSIIDAQRAILAALAGTSPAACVDFYEGRPSAALTSFTSSHNALMLALANADLAAISAGRGKAQVPAQPTAADFTALTTALQKAGLDAAMIGLLVDGKMPAKKPDDAALCSAVGTYLGAVRGLATDIRLRLIARSVILAAAS
ncbi:MAG: hypothetical protein KGQ37_03505 [Hyphomicrobiales bacterium]|nr:hypothetical protein [Hyphomicrobiales bacterium]